VPNRRRIVVGSEGYTFAIATITEMSMTKEMKEMRKKLLQEVLRNWKHKKMMKKTVKNPDIGEYYYSLQHSSTGEVKKSKHLKGVSYVKSVLGGMSNEDIYSPYDPDQITVTSNHWD